MYKGSLIVKSWFIIRNQGGQKATRWYIQSVEEKDCQSRSLKIQQHYLNEGEIKLR